MQTFDIVVKNINSVGMYFDIITVRVKRERCQFDVSSTNAKKIIKRADIKTIRVVS